MPWPPLGCQPKKPATTGQPVLKMFIGKATHALLELTLMQAVRKDIVVKWNEAKLIWCHQLATLDHLLLFSHCPSAPTERGMLTHHTHGCPTGAICLCTWQVSRLVVSMGHRVTCIVPVF